jgi:hypothetical protein
MRVVDDLLQQRSTATAATMAVCHGESQKFGLVRREPNQGKADVSPARLDEPTGDARRGQEFRHVLACPGTIAERSEGLAM